MAVDVKRTLKAPLVGFASVLLLILSACDSTDPAFQTAAGSKSPALAAAAASSLFEAPFLLELGDNVLVNASRGYLFVPERRSKPDGPKVAFSFVRLPSTSARPATPVFWLFGGPGSSPVTDVLDAAARASKGEDDPNGRSILAMLKDMRSVSDIVLVDQRGAGASLPRMTCPTDAGVGPIERHVLHVAATAVQRSADYRRQVERCRRHWAALGRSLKGYSAFELADDINDLRAAFGYSKISLYGISFGSQWAFTILRRHPEIIERVVLNGLEGVDHTFDMPSEVLESIRNILAAAEADPDVVAIVPEGGFLNAIEAQILRLEDEPAVVSIPHPVTGKNVDVAIGAEDFRRAWWRPVGRQQRRGAASWPFELAQILKGKLTPIALSKLRNAAGPQTAVTPFPAAMSIAIDCSLYPSAARRERLLTDQAQAVIGKINERYFAACDQLAAHRVSEAFLAPLETDVPALFFHGTWDTQTPLENALQIAPGFANGHLIVVDGGGHTVLRDVYAVKPDAAAPLIKRFLRGEVLEEVPERTVLPAPDFANPDKRTERSSR